MEDENPANVSAELNGIGSSSYPSKGSGLNSFSQNYDTDVYSASVNTATAVLPAAVSVCSSATDSGFETNNSQEWNTDAQEAEKCLACLRNSTNALFLHGKTGHRCCCYLCAKRIWFETRKCPICRKRVSNIIRILNP